MSDADEKTIRPARQEREMDMTAAKRERRCDFGGSLERARAMLAEYGYEDGPIAGCIAAHMADAFEAGWVSAELRQIDEMFANTGHRVQ